MKMTDYSDMALPKCLNTTKKKLVQNITNVTMPVHSETPLIARVSRASKLDSIFSLYPGAVVPGEQNEIEIMNLGTPTESSVPEEQMSLQLAERRAGIDMGIQASGRYTEPRKGVYSATGTISVTATVKQTNLNLRTNRHALLSISLGRLVLKLYAHFGLGTQGKNIWNNEKLG